MKMPRTLQNGQLWQPWWNIFGTIFCKVTTTLPDYVLNMLRWLKLQVIYNASETTSDLHAQFGDAEQAGGKL